MLVGPNQSKVLRKDVDKIEGSFAEHKEAVKKLGFRLFVKRAKLPGKQNRHIRVRPRFDDWAVEGTLRLVGDLPEEVLRGVLGKMVFGNWRPNCPKPGPYGQVELEELN